MPQEPGWGKREASSPYSPGRRTISKSERPSEAAAEKHLLNYLPDIIGFDYLSTFPVSFTGDQSYISRTWCASASALLNCEVSRRGGAKRGWLVPKYFFLHTVPSGMHRIYRRRAGFDMQPHLAFDVPLHLTPVAASLPSAFRIGTAAQAA